MKKSTNNKLEVVWNANLKDEGVFVVPFSHKYFTVEGQTIDAAVEWDFKNPPTLTG